MPQHTRQTNLDLTDHRILELLQGNGRMTTAELARAIPMSPSATADRVRRLVDEGVLTGFTATVDPVALGYPIRAFVRMSYSSGDYKPINRLLRSIPEILEAHHVTGNDCFIMNVVARSTSDLERITSRLQALGPVSTNVVYSSPVPPRGLRPALPELRSELTGASASLEFSA